MSQVVFALLLSAFAGLSTTLGSAIAWLVPRPGPAFMALTLGFSAGVMIYISFVELLAAGLEEIGFLWGQLAFFVGFGVMLTMDLLIPHSYQSETDPGISLKDAKLLRTGLFVALGIAIHNFPEGLATFAAALSSRQLGIAIALTVAIHNIPEGIAVSAPVYAATGSRSKAFMWSFLSGLSEPLGAAMAGLVLLPFLSPALLGALLALVAGFMVFIALDELLPASRTFGREHLTILGVVLGMIVMAASLALLT
ncbi:MAG: zinc transporter ZupT [Armatimonadota bacterium]|nr:MAG: zinc transporter ZupT [Armatimonadota bacterium]